MSTRSAPLFGPCPDEGPVEGGGGKVPSVIGVSPQGQCMGNDVVVARTGCIGKHEIEASLRNTGFRGPALRIFRRSAHEFLLT